MGMTRTYLKDANLEFQDTATIAADVVGKVAAVAKIIDFGGAHNVSGDLVIRVTAMEIASSDEQYDVVLQGSSSATFASDINTLGRYTMGAKEVLGVASIGVVDKDGATGTHVMPFHNHLVNEDGDQQSFRYLRVVHDVTGTIATGITYESIYASNIKGN